MEHRASTRWSVTTQWATPGRHWPQCSSVAAHMTWQWWMEFSMLSAVMMVAQVWTVWRNMTQQQTNGQQWLQWAPGGAVLESWWLMSYLYELRPGCIQYILMQPSFSGAETLQHHTASNTCHLISPCGSGNCKHSQLWPSSNVYCVPRDIVCNVVWSPILEAFMCTASHSIWRWTHSAVLVYAWYAILHFTSQPSYRSSREPCNSSTLSFGIMISTVTEKMSGLL